MPKEEDEHEKEILEKAQLKSEFLARFGRALVEVQIASVAEFWIGPDCELKAKASGTDFTAHGEYESPIASIANALMGPASALATNKSRIRQLISRERYAVEQSLRRKGEPITGRRRLSWPTP